MVKIYLADLTHTTITVSNDSFPLGAGMVGAYAKAAHPDIYVEVFKYPDDLKQAIDRRKPDILALSNYPWNLDLDLSFLEYTKGMDKNIITVMGGPNISYNPAEQMKFLKRRENLLDFYTLYEGEPAFLEILEAAMANGFDLAKIKNSDFAGSIYLNDGEFVGYRPIARRKELDDYPSPYQTGLFDKFYDDVLSPMLETHRGCPFRCSYCHEGHVSYTKVNRFSMDRVLGDLDYIARHVGDRVKNFLFADPNFGMFPTDIEIAEKLVQTSRDNGFPKTVFATTAKNVGERLIAISETLGRDVSMPIWMSVQSMTENVLKNIRRSNINVESMVKVQNKLKSIGSTTKSELILCLPGETLETHLESLVKLMNLRVDQVICYQLMLVNGSEMKTEYEMEGDPNLVTRWRVLPRSFSNIEGMTPSIEVEEIVVGTSTISFDDYIKARKLHLLVSIYYNSKAFEGFFKLLDEDGVDRFTFLSLLLERFIEKDILSRLLDRFCDETEGELFDSEDMLRAHYADPKNLKALCGGDIGGNLLQKYTCEAYMNYDAVLVELIRDVVLELGPTDDEFHEKVNNVAEFYRLSFENFTSLNRIELNTEGRFDYDISGWLGAQDELQNYRYNSSRLVTFHTPKKQYEHVEQYFQRYGRDPQSLGKILTRLWISEMFRQPENRLMN